ncbi:PhzF family phenazine biosynthesis protein [Amycolatopsis sp. 195334CR]|uniref:PhzF family phenazine biosynthesis protein n=1 Tax=Amycolatopsis sp. 195334CR TaxID=2814588 RepID=UPI001A8E17D1|nr:PhzF family phenazine biosynthesis isomerase [Amycolatopsis sp. 195334CR]MBN6035029.1 PhzF family phenazine biosynthesis isomerase [Amycolatopsis sp. 195334CR]
MTNIERYTAFDVDGEGGNPAGVVLDAEGLDEARMLEIAAELGYSETAFLFPGNRIRYFSPLAEVAFCGHATIATAVAHAERFGVGTLALRTAAGEVAVETRHEDGKLLATLTSVTPSVREVTPSVLGEALAALRWDASDLDPALPPRVGFAGNHHLVLAVSSRERLAALDYDFEALGALMAREDWTTVQLVWSGPDGYHARDPFPPGGVYEDPATGAAAAAFGAYLREQGTTGRIRIHQGEDMGRPSLLLVDIPADGGISVSGTATRL